MTDSVNHPAHYCVGHVETIDTHPIELPKPDYAFIYAKLARHVAAAAAAMCGVQLDLTKNELNEAMRAIETFEKTFAIAHFIIKSDDN